MNKNCIIIIIVVLVVLVILGIAALCMSGLSREQSVGSEGFEYNHNNIHFITYGNKNFEQSKKRIAADAKNTGWFKSITAFGPKDIAPAFSNEFKDILKMKRGGGYWVWKYYFIPYMLNKIDYGDFLIYVDSGCTVNIDGQEKLQEWFELIKNSEHKIISFQYNQYFENQWTTKEIFDIFGVDDNDDIKESGQYMGGILIMQKHDSVINLFDKCLESIRKDPLIITDYYNDNQPFDGFKESRHDQSILSVARKKYGSIVIPNEIDTESTIGHKHIPFWASRRWG